MAESFDFMAAAYTRGSIAKEGGVRSRGGSRGHSVQLDGGCTPNNALQVKLIIINEVRNESSQDQIQSILFPCDDMEHNMRVITCFSLDLI